MWPTWGFWKRNGHACLWDGLDLEPAIQPFTAMGPSVAERPSIARIAQDLEHGIVDERRPMNGSCMRPRADAARKEQSLLPKILHRGPCRRSPFEGGKQDTNGLLDLGIGIEPNGIDISHRPDQPAVGA